MECSSGCNTGCSTRLVCPCPAQGNPSIDSVEKLINCYWNNHQQLSVEETWYGSLESLDRAVHEAALALADENVDLDHVPDRIPLTELAAAKQRLLGSLDELSSAEDFDALLSIVGACLDDLQSISSELVFLTALRIGMQAGFMPERIYLNGEVRHGAALFVELDDQSASIERSELPRIFQHPDLPATVVQGCLSMCRNQLLWLKQLGQIV